MSASPLAGDVMAWEPSIEDRPGPRYVAIADAIADGVRSGELPPGTKLPTHRELAAMLGVTVGTVTRGYSEASRRGITSGEVGRGTFVRRTEPALGSWLQPAPDPEGGPFPRVTRSEINLAHSIMLSEELDEGRTLQQTLIEVADQTALGPLIADYSAPGDAVEHREAAARWLRLRLPGVTADEVTLVAGAQHGLLVVLGALTRPGDVVLTEAITYPGIKAVAQTLGLRLVGLPMDEHGVRPDALQDAIRTMSPAAAYLVPTIHNPTTITAPASRRAELARIIEAHESLFVLEDDAHGWIDTTSPPPLATLLPDRTVLLTTVSKLLAPGLRVGFTVTPSHLRERVRATLRGSMWMVPPVMAEITSRWLVDGTAEAFLEVRRRTAHDRVQLAREAFTDHELWSNPHGFYVWLVLPEPWRREDFVHAASRRGVQIVGAGAFAVGRDHVPHAVRICVGSVRQRAQLERALSILTDLLREDTNAGMVVV